MNLLTNKNLVKISTAALFLGSVSAYANTGDVRFIGSVSAVTCDVVADVDGDQSNLIDLGTMTPDGEDAPVVTFNLTPRAGTSCEVTTAHKIDVTWESFNFNAVGLKNNGGTATGAHIQLTDVNDKNLVTGDQTTADIAVTTDGTFSIPYEAQIVKTSSTDDATAGTILSSAKYAIAYR